MKNIVLAYDLGTGGCKASLFDATGASLENVFCPYPTLYPQNGWHEQNPDDWFDSIVRSTRRVLETHPVADKIVCISISGHSLGFVPVDRSGRLLRRTAPIWSDTRAEKQAEEYFETADYRSWYMATGNGFPPQCYPLFKLMWYRENEPNSFRDVYKILGTKDYINYRLTGRICTDHSYASGSGAYLLDEGRYSEEFLSQAGFQADLFPEIILSTDVVGPLTAEAAETLGLSRQTLVVCGGVDNSCMAAGAGSISDGDSYTSLGSSAWIAISSKMPLVDFNAKSYVFTHVVPSQFVSAVSIFSAGSTLHWVKNVLCKNLDYEAAERNIDGWELLNSSAESSPIGSNKLLFNPSLAGGTPQEPSPYIRGSFSGIDLRHTQADVIRAAMEGITMNLQLVLRILTRFHQVSDAMMIVGGGSKSLLWRQIFADVFQMNIVKSSIDQDAGSLGAVAVGAVGTGLWPDFSRIPRMHTILDVRQPIGDNVRKYQALLAVFSRHREAQADIGNALHELKL